MIRQFVMTAALLALAAAETPQSTETRSTYGAVFPSYGASRSWENPAMEHETPMMSSTPASGENRNTATTHRRMSKD